jgi:rhodanese-related sulfurtransferase
MLRFLRAAVLASALLASCASQAVPTKKLSADELGRLLEKEENLFFLDVREPREIAQLGSLPGYVNIPIGQLEARLKEIPKDKVIITA